MTLVSDGGPVNCPAAERLPATGVLDATAGAELTIQQVCDWASRQTRRLAEGYGLGEQDRDLFLLAQTVKLSEEVGELHAEVLGRTKFQRAAKAARYTDASLADELADVTICVAILAEMLSADLSGAVRAKIARLEARP
jgi:NTP pyrophosphatase (non-canonical NTP hydrolase)